MTVLSIITQSNLGPEFSAGGITPSLLRIDVSKVTLGTPILGQTNLGGALAGLAAASTTTSAASISDVQLGVGNGKYITADVLKGAAALAFAWPLNIAVTGQALYVQSLDSNGVAVSAHQGGAGNAHALVASVNGTGNGNAVDGGISGNGSGAGVHGAINGNGLGAGVEGVNWGSGPGAGVIGTIQGTGTGNGVRGVVFGANASSAVQGVAAGTGGAHGIAGVATATGTGYGVFGHSLNGGFSIYANGNMYAAGTITSSDEALKTNITPVDPAQAVAWSKALAWKSFFKYQNPADYATTNQALEQIGLPPVSVSMTPDNAHMIVGTQVGLIAQDVQALAASTRFGTYLVQATPSGTLALDYTSIQAIVNAGVAARLAALETKAGL